jgi:hypothetical protein
MQEPSDPQASPAPASGTPQRRRRRRKVRKRIRVKKKSGPWRKVRKVIERIVWVLVIAGFLVTLVVLMRQLNISDDKAEKKRQQQKKRGMFERVERPPSLAQAPLRWPPAAAGEGAC